MIDRPIGARVVIAGSVLGLVGAVAVGGTLISAADSVGLSEGLWLAFTVVTTVGFGDGPQTAWGRLAAGAVFITAAVSWFGVIVVAVEVGMSRFQHTALVQQALGPLARRRGPRLFHDN